MKQYLNVLKQIMDHGHDHGDRTGTGRRSIFATQERFDLKEGFPLVTTRKVFTKGLIIELLWFIRGSTNNKELTDNKVNIWNLWALTEADVIAFAEKNCSGDNEFKKFIIQEMSRKIDGIGPMYGHIWRNAPNDRINIFWPEIKMENIPYDKLVSYKEEYNKIKEEHNPMEGDLIPYEDYCKLRYYSTVDQLNELVIGLKERPFSSRHIVSAWIPSLVPFETLSPQENIMLEKGSLAACHMMFQCFVTPADEVGGKNKLSLQVYIRSNDVPKGAPFNIAQYALLTHMLAQVCDMDVGEFIWTTGDAHVYLNQKEQVLEQLSREPLPLPKLWLNPEVKSIFDFKLEDIEIQNYQHHPEINYPISK